MNYTLSAEVRQYNERGWRTVFPLPSNEKKPPPLKITGNVPEDVEGQNRNAWARTTDGCNYGLRLPATVISLDVDHYGNKKGADTLEALEKDLGDLPETVRSTRRGVDNPSGQRFYRVPAGFKWVSDLGNGIEIVQMTHRYSVVWPSVVDGDMYKWYSADGNEMDTPPTVDDLPELPERWTNFLKKGDLSLKNAPAHDLSVEEADKWLSKVAPGFSEEPGPIFTSVLEDEELFSDNGHGTMVRKQKHFLTLAVLEGQPGLKKAMAELERLFIKEVSNRRFSEKAAQWEFKKALYSGVEELRGDIEHKKAVPFVVKYSPALLEGFTDLTGAKKAAEAFTETVNHAREMLCEFPTEFAVGEILAHLLPDIVAVEEGKDTPAFFDGSRGRDLTKTELRRVLKNQLRTVLEAIRPEEDDDYLKDAVKNASRFANQTRNHSAVVAALATALADNDREADISEFDTQPHLLGLDGNLVVDLSMATPDCEVSDAIRPRDLSQREFLRKSLVFDVQTSIEALEALEAAGEKCAMQQIMEEIEPDEETRSFLFEVYGYGWYGDNSNKVAPGVRGKSDTGKSTVSKMTFGFGSDYFGTVSLEALTKSADQNNAQLARVASGRLMIMEELSFESRGQAETYKKVTGGNGFDVTGKFKDTKHYSSATPWFETNDAPNLRMGEAMRDRLVVFPFEGDTVEINRVVKKFIAKGEEYYVDPASKAWWLREVARGYARFVAREEWRDGIPDRVLECTHQFAIESDPIVEMLERYTVEDPEGYAPAEELRSWLNKDADLGEKISTQAFAREMTSRGYEKDRERVNGSKNAVSVFRGLRLKVSAVNSDAV